MRTCARSSPGTPLAKKRPRWLVAAERIATERTYLRTVAQVNPRWALHVAKHLVKFEYDDPLWDRERGQVTAREVITLFGLTLGSEKRIDFGRVDPKEARRISSPMRSRPTSWVPCAPPSPRRRRDRVHGGPNVGSDAGAAQVPRSGTARKSVEPEFLAHNRKLRSEVLDWEARLRKRDLFVGEPGVAAFYDARLPRESTTARRSRRGARRRRTIARFE